MEKAGISYIITTYNRPILLQKAIASVMAEKKANIPAELIIVDDCSDKEIEIQPSVYEAFNGEVTLLRNEYNLYVIGARNRGINAAKYAYLLLLDDDDVSFIHRTEVLFSLIQHSKYAFVTAKCFMETKNSRMAVPNANNCETNPCHYLANFAHINGIIWRKEDVIKMGGFNPKIPYFGEHITLIELLLAGKTGFQSSKIVATFQYIEAGITAITHKKGKLKRDLQAMFQYFLEKEELPSDFQKVCIYLVNAFEKTEIERFEDYLNLILLKIHS